jgi:dTDP-4-amino-4,6-dideoxygalactose transaminase
MTRPEYAIPFNRPPVAAKAAEYVSLALRSGHISGDSDFTKRCHALLESLLGVPKVLLTTSCTHALEMAALLLDIQPGDEVIVPSFTFVSTANAFVLRGAKIAFADIRPDTLNIDESQIDALITPRTRAIVPVHYAGVGCEMDEILRVAQRHGVAVVEDNAHGLFGKYRGRWLGTFGCLATQSFHETKNISCGEGGALIVNHTPLAGRAEIIREKGTDRSRFFRGQVDRYSWVDVGSSYLPSDILAAVLLSQMEDWMAIQAKRRHVWETYHTGLSDWAAAQGVRLPIIPPHCEQAWHMFYMLLPSLESRQALIARLQTKGILSVFHYLPLHRSPHGQRCRAAGGDCPVTRDTSDRLLRLPFFDSLSGSEQERVIETVLTFKA